MKISIIGSNSNLARNFVKYIENENIDIELYDIQNSSLDGKSNYMQIDFSDDNSIDLINYNSDLIYIFFGLIGTSKGFRAYNEFITVNEIYLAKILNHLKKHESNSKIVYISSRLVYSDTPALHSETSLLDGKSIYAINKIASENLIRLYSNVFGLRYSIFRVGIPFGSIENLNLDFGVVSMLEKQAIDGKINMYWNGIGTRTFSHIKDICYILYNAPLLSKSTNEIYNIGGCNHTLLEVGQYFAKKYNAKIVNIDVNGVDEKIECVNGAFNFTKIQNLLPHCYVDLVNE